MNESDRQTVDVLGVLCSPAQLGPVQQFLRGALLADMPHAARSTQHGAQDIQIDTYSTCECADM